MEGVSSGVLESDKKAEVVPFDVFIYYKLLFNFIGFAQTNSTLYNAFRILLFLFYVYIMCMSSYAMYLLMPNKGLVIDAFHVFMVAVWLCCSLGTRLATDRWLKKMRDMANSGIYCYKHERLLENQLSSLRSIQDEVRMKSRALLSLYISGFTLVMFFYPISTYMMRKDDSPDEEQIVNTYLPHVYYSPYDTTTPGGYIVAYVLDVMYWVITYSTAISTNGLIISSSVQIKTQLKVLIYSLKNIQQRAYELYASKYNVPDLEASVEDLLSQAKYQRCLNFCLRSNIEHHQAVLRFKNICQPYNGVTLLNVFTITMIIHAATMYSLFQEVPVNVMLIYIATYFAENSYSYFICKIGEEVKEESSALVEVLYDIAWYNYNQNFKQTLHIMMSNTKNLIIINSHLLGFSASLESYGKLLAAVYKVMNLYRQSGNI